MNLLQYFWKTYQDRGTILLNSKRIRIFTGAFFAGLVVTSCVTTDIRPFAEQTDAMVKAVGGSQQLTREILGYAVTPDGDFSLSDYDTALSSTKSALNAILEYSKSLVALTESEARGSEAAQALGDNLNGVLGVFNASIGGPVIAVGTAINDEIAKVQAQSSLAKAVAAAQGPVDTLAKILSENIRDLSGLAGISADEAIAVNEKTYELRVRFYKQLRQQEDLLLRRLTEWYRYTVLIEQAEELKTLAAHPQLATRASALPQMKGHESNVEGIMARQISLAKGAESVLRDLVDVDPVLSLARANSDDGKVPAKILADRIVDLQETLEFTRREIAHYDGTFQEYERNSKKLDSLKTSSARALEASAKSVQSWAQAHAQLEKAIEHDRRLSMVEFSTAVQDIYAAYGELGRVNK